MKRDKPLDLVTLSIAWEALEPPGDFADRVFDAIDAPARAAARVVETRRAPIVAAAAAMLLMLFAGVYAARPGSGAASRAGSMACVEPDLGSQPD